MMRLIGYLAIAATLAIPVIAVHENLSPGLALCMLLGTWGTLYILDRIYSESRSTPLHLYLLIVFILLIFSSGVYALALIGPVGVSVIVGVTTILWVVMNVVRKPGQRQSRENAGLCTNCGYDLRMTMEVCPECGESIPESLARRRRVAKELRAKRGTGQHRSRERDSKKSLSDVIAPD